MVSVLPSANNKDKLKFIFLTPSVDIAPPPGIPLEELDGTVRNGPVKSPLSEAVTDSPIKLISAEPRAPIEGLKSLTT